MTSEVPSRARTCSRAGSRAAARKTSQVTAGAAMTVVRTPSLASCRLGSGEREGRDQDGHGEPDTAIVPTPVTVAQPTGGRSLPRLSRVSSQDAPAMPSGFPAT